MIREVLKGNRENISRLENPLVPLAPIEPRIWHGVWSTLRRNASSNSIICSRINSISIPKTHLESTMENQSHWTLKSEYFGPNPQADWSVLSFPQTTRDNSSGKSSFEHRNLVSESFGRRFNLNWGKRSPLGHLRSIEKEIHHLSRDPLYPDRHPHRRAAEWLPWIWNESKSWIERVGLAHIEHLYDIASITSFDFHLKLKYKAEGLTMATCVESELKIKRRMNFRTKCLCCWITELQKSLVSAEAKRNTVSNPTIVTLRKELCTKKGDQFRQGLHPRHPPVHQTEMKLNLILWTRGLLSCFDSNHCFFCFSIFLHHREAKDRMKMKLERKLGILENELHNFCAKSNSSFAEFLCSLVSS